MQVKIIKCAKPDFWYAECIGKIFEVTHCRHMPEDWLCEEEDGYIEKSDCEIINEQKESDKNQAKNPHKWATELRAFADGCKIQSKPVGYGDWSINNNPNWGDVGMEYRVSKGPEFPKTSLTMNALEDFYVADSGVRGESILATVNMALQHFVESGQMDAYIKERDNANN